MERSMIYLAKKNGVPAHSTHPTISDKNHIPKKVGIAQVRHKREDNRLEIVSQKELDASYYSGVNNMAHLQHADASGDLIECMSEESVNMKPRTLSPFIKNIKTFEQNCFFLEDGSLEESTLMVPEEVSSFDESTVSINNVPWAWSDGFSEGSEVMELESPPSALESMESTLILHDHKLEGSSMEFEFTPPGKMISLAAGEPINQVKESSNRFRSKKQETMWKSMTSSMANSSKDIANMEPKEQKPVNGLEVDKKQKKDILMLRSSLPVKTSLLGRVKAKKKVDVVLEPSITNEKSPTLDGTFKSVKPKQAGVICYKGPRASLSPIVIKKNTSSPLKRIHLSSKPSLVRKIESSVVNYGSRMLDSGRITGKIIQESNKTTWNAGMSKVGDKNILKQFAESQAPKSSVSYASALNNRKLRLVKNQTEAGNLDGMKEKALHVIEQKLIGVAPKSTEQKHMKMRSQRSSRTIPHRSLISSSVFLSSSCEDESDGSRSTVCDSSLLKKTHIGERKGRIPLHVVEQKLIGVALMSTEQNHTKLSSQLSSRTMSSRSSISSSSFIPSSYEEENDESQLTVSDAGGSKKTQIVEANWRKPLHSEKSDYKKIQKLTENVSLEYKSLLLDKMPFRRGKEVSPQREIHDQKKHRLMQERTVSEAENSDCETWKSSSREIRELTTAYSGTVSPGSPTVELRHQDVQEKITQALYNGRIEETANKQVEARNNKVKALVSAFESIISLQQRTV